MGRGFSSVFTCSTDKLPASKAVIWYFIMEIIVQKTLFFLTKRKTFLKYLLLLKCS